MANRRPLVQVSGRITEVALTDAAAHGMKVNLSRNVVTGGLLSAVTMSTRYTFMTGAAGLSLAITLPAASAAIDGQRMTISSTTARLLVSWSSSGATVTGLPASLAANTPVTVMYIHASTRWFVV